MSIHSFSLTLMGATECKESVDGALGFFYSLFYRKTAGKVHFELHFASSHRVNKHPAALASSIPSPLNFIQPSS